MGFKIKKTKEFLKDFSKLGSFYYKEELREVISILIEYGELPKEYGTHILRKDYSRVYDSHLDDDMILLWKKVRNTITLLRIGTHEDLF